jgi:DNA-binding transcriptional ArsR family regulator
MTMAETSNARFKSKIFYALSDPIRIEILEYLKSGEKCVCEIGPHLDLIQPLASRHLKILKNTGLIRCRKEGTKRFYTVVDPKIFKVLDGITSNLADSIKAEILKQMTCS